jgi:AcrR family transcriptional regulator
MLLHLPMRRQLFKKYWTTHSFIFLKKGYGGASVREITEASQVTKPTLYYYFKNKEELYRQLATSCFDRIYKSLSQASKEGQSALERSMNVIKEYTRLCKEDVATVRFVYMISISPERGTPDVGIVEQSKRERQLLESVVQDGVKSGEVSPAGAAALTYAISGIMYTRVGSLLVNSAQPGDESLVFDCVTRMFECAAG